MPHDARGVANEMIRRGLSRVAPTQPSLFATGEFSSDERGITPMQIQKLIFFSHAWMLGLYNRPMFKQRVEAWPFGPVVREVYIPLIDYGSGRVAKLINDEAGIPYQAHFDKYEKDLIDQVWERYAPYSGLQLSSLTHKPGTPWYNAWYNPQRADVIQKPEILNDSIRDYYQSIARMSDSNG